MASSRSRSSHGVRFGGSVRLFALFLLLSIFFSVLIDQAEAAEGILKCYECIGSGCEDKSKWTEKYCIRGLKCWAVIKKGITDPGGCAGEPHNGCTKEGDREDCYCDTDLCNGGSLGESGSKGSGSKGSEGKGKDSGGNGASSMSSIRGISIFLTVVASIAATFGGF